MNEQIGCKTVKVEMKKKLPEDVKMALSELKLRLKKIYGGKLKQLILYGSYARGDFVEGSDIDVIIVLEKAADPLKERKRYFDVAYNLDLKYDVLLSIIPFSEKDYRTLKTPLILNAKREGLSV